MSYGIKVFSLPPGAVYTGLIRFFVAVNDTGVYFASLQINRSGVCSFQSFIYFFILNNALYFYILPVVHKKSNTTTSHALMNKDVHIVNNNINNEFHTNAQR